RLGHVLDRNRTHGRRRACPAGLGEERGDGRRQQDRVQRPHPSRAIAEWQPGAHILLSFLSARLRSERVTGKASSGTTIVRRERSGSRRKRTRSILQRSTYWAAGSCTVSAARHATPSPTFHA